MNVKIEIDTKTFVRFWLVVIGFVVAALILYSARTALIIIFAAVFLAVALSMPVNKLVKILPSKSRVLSTALAYIAVVVALGAFIFLAVPPIVQQTAKIAETVPSLIEGATKQYAGVNNFVKKYDLQPQVDEALESIKGSATEFATDIGSNIISGIGSIFSVIVSCILIFVLAFLMLVEGPIWLERLWSAYKDEERMISNRKILNKMYNVVTSYVSGQISVAAIAGVVSGIVILLLSLIFNIPMNLAVPAASIMFVFSLIPMFGSSIGLLIVSIVCALNDFTAALIFLGFYLIYQQIEGNIISPKIQSKKIDLSALAILISVTIGIYFFGIAGGIISIPIAGCIRVLIDEFSERARQNRQNQEKPATQFIKRLLNK